MQNAATDPSDDESHDGGAFQGTDLEGLARCIPDDGLQGASLRRAQARLRQHLETDLCGPRVKVANISSVEWVGCEGGGRWSDTGSQ